MQNLRQLLLKILGLKKVPGISSDNFHRARFWAGFQAGVFVANLNLFGLRGDFPYCKRFVLAGTKREPSKQSLWEKQKAIVYHKVSLIPPEIYWHLCHS